MDQNIKSTAKALAAPDIKFTIKATCELSGAKVEKNAPIIWYKGAPGG